MKQELFDTIQRLNTMLSSKFGISDLQDRMVFTACALVSLSYQMPEKPFEIYEEDFVKCVMDYEMYKRGIDVKKFKENLLDAVLYSSEVIETSRGIMIMIQGGVADAD